MLCSLYLIFFFSSRRRHTIFDCDWSSDVCSSDLGTVTPDSTKVWLVCSGTTLFGGAAQKPCRAGKKVWSSTGTSFAAAATSGLAALLVSRMGRGHPDQIRAAIEQSADDLGPPGTDPYYGTGRINVARALGLVDRPRP